MTTFDGRVKKYNELYVLIFKIYIFFTVRLKNSRNYSSCSIRKSVWRIENPGATKIRI